MISTTKTIPLSALAPNEEGVIAEIRLPPERQLYFVELGFAIGETVRFIRKSPWGDPLEVELLGVRLALHLADASAIDVRRAEDPS